MAFLQFGRFGLQDYSHFDYILGFDLGHGEFSVAFRRLTGESASPILFDLNLNSNSDKKDYTAIYVQPDGTVIVGKQAIRPNTDGGCLCCYFKVNPDRLRRDETYPNTTYRIRDLLRKLVGQVLKGLPKYSRHLDFNGHGLLVIGCPSSPEWLADGRDVDYASLFADIGQEAGLDLQCVIMPESRASLVKVYKEKGKDKTGIRKGVIVFDFGSSTIDSTAMDFDKNLQTDHSIPLGASLIERTILDCICENNGISSDDVVSVDSALLAIRAAKETYYTNPESCPSVVIETAQGPIIVKLTSQFMHDITHAKELTLFMETKGERVGTWASFCKDFLTEVKEQWMATTGAEKYEGLIILTGGASRMKFISAIAEEVFPDVNPNLIETDGDPSFCVSRGLCIAAETDLRAQKLVPKVNEQIQKAIDNDTDYLREIIADNLKEVFYSTIQCSLERWVETGQNVTLNQMLSTTMSNIFENPESREQYNHIIKTSLKSYLVDGHLKPTISSAVNDCFGEQFPGKISPEKLESISFKDEEWREVVDIISIGSPISLDEITDSISLEGWLTKTIKSNVFFALAGFVVLFASALVDTVFRTEWLERVDQFFASSENKKLPKNKREQMLHKWIENRDKNLDILYVAIKSSCLPRDSTQEDVYQTVFLSALSDYINRAIDNVALYFHAK